MPWVLSVERCVQSLNVLRNIPRNSRRGSLVVAVIAKLEINGFSGAMSIQELEQFFQRWLPSGDTEFPYLNPWKRGDTVLMNGNIQGSYARSSMARSPTSAVFDFFEYDEQNHMSFGPGVSDNLRAIFDGNRIPALELSIFLLRNHSFIDNFDRGEFGLVSTLRELLNLQNNPEIFDEFFFTSETATESEQSFVGAVTHGHFEYVDLG